MSISTTHENVHYFFCSFVVRVYCFAFLSFDFLDSRMLTKRLCELDFAADFTDEYRSVFFLSGGIRTISLRFVKIEEIEKKE